MAAFNVVMPLLGLKNVSKSDLQAKGKTFKGSGIIIIVGMVGDLKGNVVYVIEKEHATKLASFMTDNATNSLDEMAKSALGELTNMITAHAATAFSAMNVFMKISTPICIEGDEIDITMNAEKVICLPMLVGDSVIDVNISFENICAT